MTRSEAYAAGFAEGRRWAEQDIRDGREECTPTTALGDGGDEGRSWVIGCRRGYRQTFADYDAGTLTREMFELAPRAPR